jgi:hypothetical protein
MAEDTSTSSSSTINIGSDNADSIHSLRSAFSSNNDSEGDDQLQEIQKSNLRVELYHKRAENEMFLGQIGVSNDVLTNLPACALRLDLALRSKPGGAAQEHVKGQMVVKLHKMTTLRVSIGC